MSHPYYVKGLLTKLLLSLTLCLLCSSNTYNLDHYLQTLSKSDCESSPSDKCLVNQAVLSDFKLTLVEEGDNIVSLIPEDHQYTLIFLHGLTDVLFNNMRLFGNEYQLLPNNKIKVVMPFAPLQRLSRDPDHEVTSWFDIHNFGWPFNSSEDDVKATTKVIEALIEKELKLVNSDPKRIFLGGISQGWIQSAHTFLESKYALGGILGLSGSILPCIDDTLRGKREEVFPNLEEKKKIPILITHGTDDTILKVEDVMPTYDVLKETGFKATIKTYEGCGHFVNDEAVKDIHEFLESLMKSD